jgi:uncharacterized protein YndB with AHSA1/START domain
MSVTHAGFTIERRFGCTPAKAFRAFSDPELKRQWFANPSNRPDDQWRLDFRVGGGEVNVGGAPDEPPHTFKSRFHDIVEDERIVFTYDLLFGDRLVSVSLATIEFHPDGDGTRLVFTEHGAFFDDLEDPAGREHGTGKLLDALERVLGGEAVR